MVALRLKIRFSVSFTSCQKKTASFLEGGFPHFLVSQLFGQIGFQLLMGILTCSPINSG